MHIISCLQTVYHLLRVSEHEVQKVAPKNTGCARLQEIQGRKRESSESQSPVASSESKRLDKMISKDPCSSNKRQKRLRQELE